MILLLLKQKYDLDNEEVDDVGDDDCNDDDGIDNDDCDSSSCPTSGCAVCNRHLLQRLETNTQKRTM